MDLPEGISKMFPFEEGGAGKTEHKSATTHEINVNFGKALPSIQDSAEGNIKSEVVANPSNPTVEKVEQVVFPQQILATEVVAHNIAINIFAGLKDLQTAEAKSAFRDHFRLLHTSIIEYDKGAPKTGIKGLSIEHNEIGHGYHGIVYPLHADPDNIVIKKGRVKYSANAREIQTWRNEFEITRTLDHPCLVKVLGLAIKNYPDGSKKPKLIMERVQGQDLDQLRESGLRLSFAACQQAWIDTCDCMLYLSTIGVAWNDVNSGSLMVCQDQKIKIVDFGGFFKPNSSTICVNWLVKTYKWVVEYLYRAVGYDEKLLAQYLEITKECDKFLEELYKMRDDPSLDPFALLKATFPRVLMAVLEKS